MSPENDDRFVKGETVLFKAAISGSQQIKSEQVIWTSSLNGPLGSGLQIETGKLSAGIHHIRVIAGSAVTSTSIRIFDNLWQLYQSAPSKNELAHIQSDFTIKLIDETGADEKWLKYSGGQFDQKSSNPSTIISLARLDILRRQSFEQPLPFGNGKSAYETLISNVRTLNLGLGCDINTAGGRTVNLNRNFSVWDARKSGSTYNLDACKIPLESPPVLSDYTNSLYLLLHEARHCEPNDPGHVSCKGYDNMDLSLDNGSGHARAALYLIWVYKYGIYDPPAVKAQAKSTALSILSSRFCSPVKHANPAVQVVLKELGF